MEGDIQILAFYIPSQADRSALNKLYNIIVGLQDSNLEVIFIVLGYFNKVSMKRVLPKYYKNIYFPRR